METNNNANTGISSAADLIAPFMIENLSPENLNIITHHILARNIDKVREYLLKEGENPTINYYAFDDLEVINSGEVRGPDKQIPVSIELLENAELDWEKIEKAEALIEDIKEGALKGLTSGLLKKLKSMIQGKEVLMQDYMKLAAEGTLYYAALSKLSGDMAIVIINNIATLVSRDQILHNIGESEVDKIMKVIKDKLFNLNIRASGEVTDKDTGEQKEFHLHININHSPLNISFDTGEAYFPANFYIYNTGLPYTQWLEQDKKAVWEILKQDLSKRNSSLNFVGDDKFNNWIIKHKPDIKERKAAAEYTFPIVKMDRQTDNIGRIIFQHKGLFSNYNKLKTREEILEEYKNKNNLQELTPGDKRIALMEAGEYKSKKFVIKDFGSYAIGFNIYMYEDYLMKAQEKLKENLENPEIFDQEKREKEIEEALKEVRAYILAHKIFKLILAEVDQQKRTQDLIIPKKKMLNYLGYRPEEKQIYGNIKEALFCLRYLDYVFFDYTKHSIKKDGKTEQGNMIGNFIYNINTTDKNYILGVNPYFVGCIKYMFEYAKLESRGERKKIFNRGYYEYPTALIPMSKDYSDHGYFLTDFLIREKGNSKLNIAGRYKVIALKCERYMREAKINNSRADRRKAIFIKTLKEIHIIENTDPKIEELEKMRPMEMQKTTLRIFIKEVEELDKFLHKILNEKAKSS